MHIRRSFVYTGGAAVHGYAQIRGDHESIGIWFSEF